jgi:hypothetical protein
VEQQNATVRERFGRKKDVAARYSVCHRTVDYWIAQKRIPVLRIGGCVRFDLLRVDEALRRFEVKEVAK